MPFRALGRLPAGRSNSLQQLGGQASRQDRWIVPGALVRRFPSSEEGGQARPSTILSLAP